MTEERAGYSSLDAARRDAAAGLSETDSRVPEPEPRVAPRPAAVALAGVAVALLALLAVWPSVYGEYSKVWDDDDFFANPVLTKQPVGQTVREILAGTLYDKRAYYPVSQLSLALDAIYLGGRPFLSRLINIALHSLNALLVWAILRRILGNASVLTPAGRLAAATAAALLFAVHPTNVEPAAWVSGRKVELALFFTLAAFYCLLRGKRLFLYGAACVCFGLALLSNALVLSAPLVFAAYWATVERRRIASSLLASAPLLLLAALSAGSRMVRKTTAAEVVGDTAAYAHQIPAFVRAQWLQAVDLFYPMHLLAVYPRHRISVWSIETFLGLALVLGSLAAAVVLARRASVVARLGALALAWYWIGLAPTYGHHHVQACRHMYFPAIGLFMMAGVGLAGAMAQPAIRPALKRLLLLLAGGLLASFLFLSMEQAARWRNDLDLFRYAVANDPLEINDMAHLNYAYALAEVEGQREEAVEHFKKARLANPDEPCAYLNLGLNLVKLNRPKQAEPYLKYAVFLDPSDYESHRWLGVAYHRMGKNDSAIESFRRALAIEPNDIESLTGLASVLCDLRRFDEILPLLRRAADIAPDNAEAASNLGRALVDAGKHEEAVEAFHRAIALAPNNPRSHLALGFALAELGRADETRRAFDAARRQGPVEEAEIGLGLGILAEALGNGSKAREAYLSALREAKIKGLSILARRISERLQSLDAKARTVRESPQADPAPGGPASVGALSRRSF